MKCLLITCHPLPDSYGAALTRAALQGLAAGGHEVRHLDLYAMGFDPVLSPAERRSYLSNTSDNIQALQPHVDALRWAQALVCIYPTWMYGPPAMLKGWLDRVMLPGVVFELSGHPLIPIRGTLHNIQRFVGVTTSGAPWWWLRVVGDPGRSLFMKGLRPLFARRCRARWLQLHSMNYQSDEARQRFLARVQQQMTRLD